MREILFKAKRVDNCEWVEGNFYTDQRFMFGESCCDVSYIRDDIHEDHIVFENTICQYIGREDINGNKVFEGDMLECCKDFFLVEYSEEQCRYIALRQDGHFFTDIQVAFWYNDKPIAKIVDNIHNDSCKWALSF